MVFTTSNGIRFRDKDEVSIIGNFIACRDKHVSVLIGEDLVLSFDNGKYEGSYEIPF